MDGSKVSLDYTSNYRMMFESTESFDDYSNNYIQGHWAYQIGNKLGQGSYSSVYTCREVNSGSIYACKIMNNDNDHHEAKVLKLLNYIYHFGITRLIESFTYNRRFIIVEELAQGCSLASLLKICKSKTEYVPIVPVDFIKTIIRQLLVTCRFIHKQGVAHNDIKMDNIYILDNSRLVLIDFGQAYLCQDENFMSQAYTLGNIAFYPPEVLINTQTIGASFTEQNQIKISQNAQLQMDKIFGYLKSEVLNTSAELLSSVSLSKYHHIRTLFDIKRHSITAGKEKYHIHVWVDAMKRLYRFSYLQNDSIDDNFSYYQLLEKNKEFISYKFYASDSYPTYDDLLNIQIALKATKITKEKLHVFNKKLAVDSWGVGMIALILLLGEYPFRNMQPYETVAAIYLLSQAIKVYLDNTLHNIFIENNFYLYEQQCLKQEYIIYKIEPGPLPTNIPSDLFLLIAGLLYPNPRARLSISECLGCPFVEAYQTYLEEKEQPLNAIVQPKEQFERVDESMSRIDRLRSSVYMHGSSENLENGVSNSEGIMQLNDDTTDIVEPSGDEDDDSL